MLTRTSIELHPAGCRLVEVEVSPKGRRAALGDVRVRTFVSQVVDDDDPAAFALRLSQLRQERKLAREAWVTIWGLRSAQQLLRLPPAKDADLRALAAREAKKDLVAFETDGQPASVAIVAGGDVQVGPHRRREVSLVAVSAADVGRRIQPCIDAGFLVSGVLTPALALTAIARMQREMLPGNAAAYVALASQATCLAIVRDRLLLFAREIPWGYETDQESGGEADVASRLTSEIRRSILFFKQTFRTPVESIVLCGDMPDLRALTLPLGSALNVPVQTLDSLAGIDAATLPKPAEQFRSEVGALRLAIAAGADAAPPANLLPNAIRVTREARTRFVRVGAAVAASLALLVGWYVLEARAASRYQRDIQSMQQEISRLEPEAQRLDLLRERFATATGRQSALDAFESQGPRVARLLEAFSRSVPDEIVITSITIQVDGIRWRATVTGLAVTDDAASGQAAVNRLLRDVSASPYVGAPVQPPSLRVVSGTGAVNVSNTNNPASPIPDGMSGVEFVAQFVVAK